VSSTHPDWPELARLARCQSVVRLDGDEWSCTALPPDAEPAPPLYEVLRGRQTPGLVLFSSGTTGPRKAAVHDVSRLLRKFAARRHDLRTLVFMAFDHIGGQDTLLYALSNGSCLILVDDLSPEAVCRAVERHKVEVLPTVPTFLSLLALGRAYERFDLSSVKYVTYGSEMMSAPVLARTRAIFPSATLLQKYGATEVGTLRSASRSSDSLWVKVGGEGYQTRIVDGMLQIKAESAMLGYLNAPRPFTDDGWFVTKDCVEVDGDYIRFLGRESEIINVGGRKVFPGDVEAVIRELPDVADVTVYGQPNAILGQVVCADVEFADPGDGQALRASIKRHCIARLLPHQVPALVRIQPYTSTTGPS
jgi:acyl-coenzyme A synthetase/AMP-(fatty) acid ligase